MMGEISPAVKSPSGIFRESRFGGVLCEMSPMPDIALIREQIERAMRAKGFSRRSLSKAADLSESAVRDLLTRTDNPGIGTLTRVAEALEMPIDQLTGTALKVPVLGDIGAGGQVIFATDPDKELSEYTEFPTVPRPPLTTGRLIALRVVGSSMLPKYEDGDIIYIRRDHEGLLPTYLNRYCAVRTGDGGTWLKILSPGSEAGCYTLRSLNAPDMENVEVVWAAPVLFVMPKQAENAG
jgi:phage repressor protein C with HTH and peptisase S24 domain